MAKLMLLSQCEDKCSGYLIAGCMPTVIETARTSCRLYKKTWENLLEKLKSGSGNELANEINKPEASQKQKLLKPAGSRTAS